MAPGVRPDRRAYHHGDLRRALLDAAIELARTGGPEAVVLRAATRAAGVAPNAAYRHFADRDALLVAASLHAQSQLAAAMERELAQVDPDAGPLEHARAAVRAVGAGYLRFARAEPGLFRTATVNEDLRHAADPAGRGPGGRTPFELLGDALDELVTAGGLAARDRRGADLLAWSAVHGLATLLLTGPLRGLDGDTVDALDRRLLDMVERGLGQQQPRSSPVVGGQDGRQADETQQRRQLGP